MTYRSSDSSCKSCYSQPQSRLNQQIKSEPNDEGCPVLEESGSVCGETESLNVFLDFKKKYDDCLKKLERSADGKITLKKLAPFQRLIDHLWEQNAMLIETVGELEEEATCRLSTLQDKLNKSCQKIDDYQQDINSLITIIHRFCEKGVLDPEGVEFKTLCPSYIYGPCENSCTEYNCTYTYQPQTSSRSLSVNYNNFGTFDGISRKSDDCSNCMRPCKILETKVPEKDSDLLRLQSSNENISVLKFKSSHSATNSENKCSCINKYKENKSVTWVSEVGPKSTAHDECDDNCSCDRFLSLK